MTEQERRKRTVLGPGEEYTARELAAIFGAMAILAAIGYAVMVAIGMGWL